MIHSGLICVICVIYTISDLRDLRDSHCLIHVISRRDSRDLRDLRDSHCVIHVICDSQDYWKSRKSRKLKGALGPLKECVLKSYVSM